jgi:hypothetical protein
MAINKLSSGNHQFILDANKFKMSAGVYILKVEVDGIPAYKRIVKVE